MKHSEFVATAMRLMVAQEPFLVTGSPGSGKTAGLAQATNAAKRRLIITHPIISEEVDYRGLPGFVQTNGRTEAVFLPFGFLRELTTTTKPTTVIIDDVGQARLSVQAALMQLVQLREIDGTAISDTVTFALASNRREDRAAVQGIVSALVDRCVCVLELEVDASELASWLLTQGYNPILAAFIRWKPDEVRFDAKNEFQKSSTPRSIAGLGRLIQLGLDTPELCAAAVGPGFAAGFLAFRRLEATLLTVEQILANPKKVKLPAKEEQDVLYALVTTLASRITTENFPQAMQFLERCPPEFAVLALRDAQAKVPNLATTPAFVDWAERHTKLLGITE